MAEDNYEEQEQEIEAIKYIYLDDLQVLEERPFKFEVLLHGNNDAPRNHLAVKLTFELPPAYPQDLPDMRVKNLTPDIIHNNVLLDFDRLLSAKAEEARGTPMLYEVSEALREKLSEMNDIILKKLDE
jgi:ubiquitin-protein ligase